MDNFKIVGREGHNMVRTITEAIYTRVNNPALNKDTGKYNLPYIWDKVLHSPQDMRFQSKTYNNMHVHNNSAASIIKRQQQSVMHAYNISSAYIIKLYRTTFIINSCGKTFSLQT